MSYFDCQDPVCESQACPHQVALEIIPRAVDLGGFQVERVLPSTSKKSVGPFIFWDQAGPGEFITGTGLDVRPHPHICLSTMTYLFQGSMEHRDTLGSHQLILPGEVNLMTAGRGIAHSERTPQAVRQHPHALFGIQSWIALPLDKEEMAPTFQHTGKDQIPELQSQGLRLRVVTGEWEGVHSPVITHNDALFLECQLDATTAISIPAIREERAVYILQGDVKIDNVSYQKNRMLILKPNCNVKVEAMTNTVMIILGGTPLESPRYLWWNFVASTRERIEQAKTAWRDGQFGKIPGDDKEFIPLPDNIVIR